ncbi:MAG: hypothetical protein EP305_04410 [Bacteroidetes bacterium]|nr:MAG: hypothetical protein EP305_04410 [Bacteroidota bacterium]
MAGSALLSRSVFQIKFSAKLKVSTLKSATSPSCKPLLVMHKKGIRLELIKLNKEFPEIEFKLNSKDSYLLIHSVYITAKNSSASQWSKFASNVQLNAELEYIVFDDPHEKFVDERRKQFPIHLLIDPHQVQPIFKLNKLIKNMTFTLGKNPEQKFYRILKLEIQNPESLDSDHTLEFNIEKFKIDH